MGVDPAVRRLLRCQNCAIHGQQLRKLGLTRDAIRARVARGSLVRAFQDVYIAGDPEMLPLARESASLLSLGPASFLSHRSAAAVWGFATPNAKTIDVTVVDSHPRSRPGVRIHRVATLQSADTDTKSNLRLTSPARAMIEFASQATSSELEHAFGEARAKRLVNDHKLDQALKRAPANNPAPQPSGTCSTPILAPPYTRSKAERILRKTLKAAELPQPTVNVPLLGYTADFLWAEHKLILEVDGYGTHGNRLRSKATGSATRFTSPPVTP